MPSRSDKGLARVEILLSITIFLAFGFGFVLVNMLVGAVVRPSAPNAEKSSIYECGEPTVGSSWVQFDLRFYVVALFYLIFDVEVALIWPIAVVFRNHAGPALVIAGIFMALILIGYVYEWYSGSLDWIRSSVNTASTGRIGGLAGARLGVIATSATEARRLARRDPELLEEEAATGIAT
jgi:NADH-quinone oxidoreductase subunit A